MDSSAIDEDNIPPYIDAEDVDLNMEADLDTVSTLVSIAASIMLILAYMEFEDG